MRDPRRRSGVNAAGESAIVEPVPASITEVSSPRVRVPDVVPTGWLDRLLVAVIDLPLSQGEAAVVEAIVDAVAGILPAYAVGAFVTPDASTGRGGEALEAALVVKRLPAGMVEGLTEAGPPRIFPGLPHEYVAAVPGLPGSTLHVASHELELEPESSPAAHLVDRAALALGRAIPGARLAVSRGGADFEERMVQADKLATFGQIAAGVVHELNNPLTSIVAYSDYLIRKEIGAGGDASDLERLRRISEAANRMLRFTRDLVSYARPSSGVAQTIVLHDVIDQAIAFCEHVLAAATVRVERQYGSDVRTVTGVTEQLVQVFINLLTNACQAASDLDARVVVSTRCDPSSIRPILVVVEDNGSGIAPEHLPHVFAPFFTTKTDKQGTGLGLSIVRSLIEGHGGTIRVESQPGRGARFVVELPIIR
jgi:two-component system NtrC family sensor kinase